jgi:dipicolinate synthase subunit B
MKFKNLKIALCISGTFCQFDKIYDIAKELKNEGATVVPVFSEKVLGNFTHDSQWVENVKNLMELTDELDYTKPLFIQIEKLTKNENIDLAVVISTGNTLSKIANAISDDNIPFLVKGLQRNNRPTIVAVSSNDALGLNFTNIGKLLNTKNFFFVPFNQDNSELKPHSLISDYSLINDTIIHALQGEQIQPIIYSR